MRVYSVAIICFFLLLFSSASFAYEAVELKKISPIHRRIDTRSAPSDSNLMLPDARIYNHMGRENVLSRENFPLLGGIVSAGTYYVTLDVGGQPFNVITDTGSSILYVPGSSCVISGGDLDGQPCPTKNPPLAASAGPELSCTAIVGCTCGSGDVCTVSTTFGDGSSVDGNVVNTTVTLGNFSATTPVASVTTASSTFVNKPNTSIDGLWGMGYQHYSASNTDVIPTVLDAFVANGMTNIFAMLLEHEGGTLTLGGFDLSLIPGAPAVVPPPTTPTPIAPEPTAPVPAVSPSTPTAFELRDAKATESDILYTDVIQTGWYVVTTPDLFVGMSTSSLGQFDTGDKSGITTIVDSGTTLLVLPTDYYNHLKSAMISVATENGRQCPPFLCSGQTIFDPERWCFPEFEFDQYPTIQFVLPYSKTVNHTLSGFGLTLTPRQYMLQSVDTAGRSCSVFGIASSTSDFFIMGDTLMTQYYTIFDRVENRVGFVPLGPSTPNAPFSAALPNLPSLALSLFVFILSIFAITF